MALSPDTLDALDKALKAVIEEAGHDPQYAQLVEHLQAAEEALPGEGTEPASDGEPDQHADDPNASADDMFAAAEKKHRAARSGQKGDHPNPFGGGA